MKLNQGESADSMDWSSLFSNRSRLSRPSGKSWQAMVFVIVALLHVLLIGYGLSWRTTHKVNIPLADEALQVTFIDRDLSSPPEHSNVQKTDTGRNIAVGNRNADEISIDDPVADQGVKSELDKPLRLTMAKDDWKISSEIGPRNPLDRQRMALPGRAEPYVEGIRFSRQLTPEQRLAMAGRILFGGVDYDPCKEARYRMASGQSQANRLDVDADLRIIEKNCRP